MYFVLKSGSYKRLVTKVVKKPDLIAINYRFSVSECLEKKLRDNFNFPFPLCNEVQTTTARSLKIKKKRRVVEF